MAGNSHFVLEGDVRRYEALLQTADLVVRHGGLADLFAELVALLRDVAAFDFVDLSLYDSVRDSMRMFLWDGSHLNPVPFDLSVEASSAGQVWRSQEPSVSDSLGEQPVPPPLEMLVEKGARSYCCLPLTTARRRLGTLGLASSAEHAYQQEDIRLLRRVTQLAALAVENALTRVALEVQKQRLRTLVEVSSALVSNRDLAAVFQEVSNLIRSAVRQDYASVTLYDQDQYCFHMQALDYSLSEPVIAAETVFSLEGSACGQAFGEGRAKIFSRVHSEGIQSGVIAQLFQHGFQSACCLPLVTTKGAIGTLNLASREEDAFLSEDLDFLRQVAARVAAALDNLRAYQEIEKLTNSLKGEKLYLQDEIRSVLNFEEIIGESPALRTVLSQVNTVAPSDATVLILGETGTGKELIARAIHRMSTRKDASFIKLNCAAIPTGLLESELFGHEKGAFTGAVSQKIGRLELADGGTLFLDEVGEIPLELQPKLLRALQDQEFERLGGVRTIKVSIRLIAATNRDLAQCVADKEFRSDLYYRLHVFPIRLPSLRERTKDIPLLVRYFVRKFARRLNKQIENIPSEAMTALTSWRWPGNVRELENFIERSVILTDGPTLRAPLAELIVRGAQSESTLESMEREHILRVLRETGGVISGVHGAAVRLGMKRTTLQSRMQKMGITREEYEN
jgi:formate hydrogenlyase transcriptional activator